MITLYLHINSKNSHLEKWIIPFFFWFILKYDKINKNIVLIGDLNGRKIS